MSEFLMSYGLFLAKVLTGLLALAFAVAIIAGARNKKTHDPELRVTKLNDKYRQMQHQLQQAVMDKKQFKRHLKREKKSRGKKPQGMPKNMPERRLYVLEFEGDIKATGVAAMRDEITALLSVAQPQDEVLLKLHNSGGMVHEHGLAASQLQRIKDAKLAFTVAVDKVAASGGYMMACIADKIIAAPFAILGSIGVLAQLPNFNRMLDKAGIDFEQHTAGEYKRTVTMFGKNSEKERDKLKLELQETHTLFRDFVSRHRPKLDIDKVATGEHWYGTQALELNLVDELKTSDEFLLGAIDEYTIFEVKMDMKKPLPARVLSGFTSLTESVRELLAERQGESRFR